MAAGNWTEGCGRGMNGWTGREAEEKRRSNAKDKKKILPNNLCVRVEMYLEEEIGCLHKEATSCNSEELCEST